MACSTCYRAQSQHAVLLSPLSWEQLNHCHLPKAHTLLQLPAWIWHSRKSSVLLRQCWSQFPLQFAPLELQCAYSKPLEWRNPANLTLGHAHLYCFEESAVVTVQSSTKTSIHQVSSRTAIMKGYHVLVIEVWWDADSSLCWRELQCLVVRLREMRCTLGQDF